MSGREKLIKVMARAYTKAPFPSTTSLNRMAAALDAAEAELGAVMVPLEADDGMAVKGHAAGVRINMMWERITYEMALELQTEYLPAALNAAIAHSPYRKDQK